MPLVLASLLSDAIQTRFTIDLSLFDVILNCSTFTLQILRSVYFTFFLSSSTLSSLVSMLLTKRTQKARANRNSRINNEKLQRRTNTFCVRNNLYRTVSGSDRDGKNTLCETYNFRIVFTTTRNMLFSIIRIKSRLSQNWSVCVCCVCYKQKLFNGKIIFGDGERRSK